MGLSDFAAAVQSGQDLSLENLYPASVSIAGVNSGAPISCSGGGKRVTGQSLMPGGFLSEFDVSFRIRVSLCDVAPSIGAVLTFGGVNYRIAKVLTPAQLGIYIIGADNPSK